MLELLWNKIEAKRETEMSVEQLLLPNKCKLHHKRKSWWEHLGRQELHLKQLKDLIQMSVFNESQTNTGLELESVKAKVHTLTIFSHVRHVHFCMVLILVTTVLIQPPTGCFRNLAKQLCCLNVATFTYLHSVGFNVVS